MPLVDRTGLTSPTPTADDSGLIPVDYARSIIQVALHKSLALSTFRRVNMPTSVSHMPVLDVLPVATWVNGEVTEDETGDGMKTATTQRWKGLVLNAEELAAIVVIPEAVLEDASIDLWSEITPRLGEAIGRALDLATFPGTNKPASWPTAIIPAAVAAGNVTVAAAGDMEAYNEAFADVENDGYMPDHVYAAVGERSGFRGWTASGVPVYLSEPRSDGRVDSIYGIDISYDRGAVLGTNTRAVVGDPTMAILGVRTDIQYKFLSEAMIDVSPELDGSQLINLAQQDSIGLRVRARFGFAVANPPNQLSPDVATRYPFAVINKT